MPFGQFLLVDYRLMVLEIRVKAWIQGHPELTAEQRAKMKTQGMAGIEALKRYREGRSECPPEAS